MAERTKRSTDPSVFLTIFAILFAVIFPAVLGLVVVVPMVLWVLAIIDAARRDFPNPNDKVVWILVLLFTSLLGAVIYYFAVMSKASNGAITSKTTTVTLILLLMTPFFWLFGLVGLILMWFKVKWTKWAKVVVTLLYVLGLIVSVGFMFVMAVLGSAGKTNTPDALETKQTVSKSAISADFAGTVEAVGYITLDTRQCGFNSATSCQVNRAIFNVLSSNPPGLQDYIAGNLGNAFFTVHGIVLGCIDETKREINSVNYGMDTNGGTDIVNNIISGDAYSTLLNSSMKNPVNLSLDRVSTLGRGAPDCYSYFRNIKIVK